MHRIPTALEAPAGKDSTDQTMADMIEDESEVSPEEAATQQLLNKDMENLLYTLSSRESEVLKLRYGLDDGREKTLEEVGRILLVRSLVCSSVCLVQLMFNLWLDVCRCEGDAFVAAQLCDFHKDGY